VIFPPIRLIRQVFGWCDLFGVVECDALDFVKLYEAFPIATHALHRPRKGSAANHEIICRTHTRPRKRWRSLPCCDSRRVLTQSHRLGVGPNAGSAIADRGIRENVRMCTTSGATKHGFQSGIPNLLFNHEPSPTVNSAYSFCLFTLVIAPLPMLSSLRATVPSTL
jgi:hypothetical protein